MKSVGHLRRRRGRRSPSGGRSWAFWLVVLLLLATAAVAVLRYGERYPLETLICVAAIVITAVSIIGYIGELIVAGWIMDFLLWIATPTIHVRQAPLEYEQVGDMTIVKLSDNIVTAGQCQLVHKQLKRLIDDHRCNFILDFSRVGKVSIRFRGVMVGLTRAARREARRLNKPYRPVAVPLGDVFRVFADIESAAKEMHTHEGDGWVVLCSVPAGIRAVPEAV